MKRVEISEHEHGVVRVFVADSQLAMEIGHLGTYDRLRRSLDVETLAGDHIQQLQTRILEEDGLQDFLAEGYGISADELAACKDALDAVQQDDVLLLIVRSSAFPDRPVTLRTDGEAKLIATLHEPNANVSFKPLPNPDPEAVLEDPPQKKRPSDAAMSGRIATVALLLMGLLVWLMIWVAG